MTDKAADVCGYHAGGTEADDGDRISEASIWKRMRTPRQVLARCEGSTGGAEQLMWMSEPATIDRIPDRG